MAEPRICLGVVTGAHGVRGLLRVKSFTEAPEDLAAYGPLSDETGARRFALTVTGRAKGAVLARIEGVGDRDKAEALKGTRLYVERAALPAPEEAETYYHADLIGLAAEDTQGRPLGRVVAVENFGAGDLLEIAEGPGGQGGQGGQGGGSLLVPFTRAAVPVIDLEGGRLVVDPPAEVEARGEGPAEPES
ncbi:MAG: ribosome maturation factor RimM [Rhodospirillales bacterium]|nr:ribosome maturation factor RimM [Rhodospirillales bacterium]